MTKLDLKLPIIRYGKLKVTNRSISKICYSIGLAYSSDEGCVE